MINEFFFVFCMLSILLSLFWYDHCLIWTETRSHIFNSKLAFSLTHSQIVIIVKNLFFSSFWFHFYHAKTGVVKNNYYSIKNWNKLIKRKKSNATRYSIFKFHLYCHPFKNTKSNLILIYLNLTCYLEAK